jgi:hypothetical protein
MEDVALPLDKPWFSRPSPAAGLSDSNPRGTLPEIGEDQLGFGDTRLTTPSVHESSDKNFEPATHANGPINHICRILSRYT